MDFVCKDPHAMVRAANVKAMLDAFQLVPNVGRDLIARHHLDVTALTPGNFILVQRWLDALKEIQAVVGPAKIRHVGRNIIETADIPPLDCESLLIGLDDVFYMNHKGNVGHYRTKRLEDGVIEVRCETPYPRNFEWGLVEGFCRKAVGTTRYSVEYIDGPQGEDLTCTLLARPMG
jgi:hypothetical protein